MINYVLSFFAGSLTTISPCVLPALPLIMGGATQKSRYGPIWIAGGLVCSFVTFGTVINVIVSHFGFDSERIQYLAAFLLILVGLLFLVAQIQSQFQFLTSPIANWASKKLPADNSRPIPLFLTGSLLGAVWSPCVGPTLGVAIGLSSQSSSIMKGVAMLILFSLGSVVPLLIVAYTSRTIFLKSRSGLIKWGERLKPVMGATLIVLGAGILSGYDKHLEAKILAILPEWWISISTSL